MIKVENIHDGNSRTVYYLNDNKLAHGLCVKYNRKNKKFQEKIYNNGVLYGIEQLFFFNKRYDIISFKFGISHGVTIIFNYKK